MKLCLKCQRCYDDDDVSCSDCKGGLRVLAVSAPRRIEVYRLERRLGSGGMGMVFEAKDLRLGRSVAIKVLQMDLLLEDFRNNHPYLAHDDEEFEKFRDEMARRFQREARAAASIDDSNVVKIFSYGVLAPADGGEYDDTPYIVMELVDGLPLQRFMRRGPAVTMEQFVVIARQVASGVKKAHQKGVIHRDLKPANIIVKVDEEDGDVQAIVVDFGIAKLAGQTSAKLTKTGTMVGTVQYMSPEQCEGGEADKRSDLYSLGVIMYEMLAGHPPFEASNLATLAHKHINEEPPPLADVRPDLPAPLTELVMRSLRKNPNERPQTAAEIASALGRIDTFLKASSLNQPAPPLPTPAFAGNEDPTLIDPQTPPTSEPEPPAPEQPELEHTDLEEIELEPPELEEPESGEPEPETVTVETLQSAEPSPETATAERAADAEQEAVQPFDEPAFYDICGRFDSDSQEVRAQAARDLYNLHPDRAESFTRALREGSPERRREIGAAIASSGLADELLTRLTGENRERTYEAFSLLFLMAKAGEVQPLLNAIQNHPSNEVRLAVVKLLALSGQKEVLPAFRRLAVRGSLPTEVRSAVMEAIYQISSSQPPTPE